MVQQPRIGLAHALRPGDQRRLGGLGGKADIKEVTISMPLRGPAIGRGLTTGLINQARLGGIARKARLPVAPNLSANFVPPERSVEPAVPVQEVDCDSDMDEQVICPQCRLPIGAQGYVDEEAQCLVHAECKAQLLVKTAQRDEDARRRQDAAAKKGRRTDFGIGWKAPKQVPRNSTHAEALGGLCALIWDEDENAVQVMTTEDPATAINLEYLALALQVRRQEGREPLFSLDPKADPNADSRDRWQSKRFEPEWLSGTSVGEVLFQADFFLKELSMGEYQQPVVGMKSALDLNEEESGGNKEWSAREWFVVRQAELLLTGDGAMVPAVQMAVEAREQVLDCDGHYQDVPITRADHPCVMYAEAFSRNFDLIAERKSVIYHLRELAKCTVLAKFLDEQDVRLEELWLGIAGSALENPSPCLMDVPQVWNERSVSKMKVQDGKIDASATALATSVHGVYGGVELGLPRIAGARVTPMKPAHLTAKMIAVGGAVPQIAIQPRAPMGAIGAAPLSFVGAGVRAPMSAIIGAPMLSGARAGVGVPPSVPRGVDLNLNGFDVEAPRELAESPVGSWLGKDFVGRGFWSSVAGVEEDRAFLKAVFNPRLCDRREDGDVFVPPDARTSYIESLRILLDQETAVRDARVAHFASQEFVAASPGPLFPSSWTPAQVVAHDRETTHKLVPRPDYMAEGSRIVQSAVPVFDKVAEDGVRFRVYQMGSLEVRTVQAPDETETTKAVFSRPRIDRDTENGGRTIARTDRVLKAVEYVERQDTRRGYYVVLETELGDNVVTEQLPDGTCTWAENPEGFEARNAFARVVDTTDWSTVAVTVGDLNGHRQRHGSEMARRSQRKNYAHSVIRCFTAA